MAKYIVEVCYGKKTFPFVEQYFSKKDAIKLWESLNKKGCDASIWKNGFKQWQLMREK